MSNADHLRDILKHFEKEHKIDITEAEEFLDAINEELSDAESKADDLEYENDKLKDRINDFEGYDYEQSYNLGLDSIYVRFENGNLNVRQKFDMAMNLISM